MSHWSEKKEKKANVSSMLFLFTIHRKLGSGFLLPVLRFVVLFYFLFSPSARRISREFLGRVHRVRDIPPPGTRDVFRHFLTFSYSLLEKLSAWTGDIQVKDLIFKTPDINIIIDQLKEGRGAVVLCSHLGNSEMLRAIASREAGDTLPQFGVTAIVDFSGTARFNKAMERVNPDSMTRLVDASSIGADTIIELKDRMQQGELVIIAADRTAKGNRGKTGEVPFLGDTAYFPQGAFVLSSLMDAPVYHMFALREDDLDIHSPYEFHIYRSLIDVSGSRRERMKKIQGLMEEYVSHLETLCIEHPYQWYNFFDFWREPVEKARRK